MACSNCSNPFEISDNSVSCNCGSVQGVIPQADFPCLTIEEITQMFSNMEGDNWGTQVVQTCQVIVGEGTLFNPITGDGTEENPLCIDDEWLAYMISQFAPNPGLGDVLAINNLALPGDPFVPPLVFDSSSTLTITPQAGALEFDGVSLYITDNNGVRLNLMETNRLYKIYPRDYNTTDPSTFNLSHSFPLTGIDITYDPYIITAQSTLIEFWPEISIFPGTTSGQVIELFIENTKVYRLVTSGAIATNLLVCGKVTISQDSKYVNKFIVRGEYASVDAAGNTTIQTISTSFTSSNAVFTMRFEASATFKSRIGGTLTVDKKQYDHFFYQ